MVAPQPAGRPAVLWAEVLLAVAVIVTAAARIVPDRSVPRPGPGEVEGRAIDVNASPWYELTYLPGVGEKRARAIVKLRGERGPFRTLEDLREVPGIGPITVREIEACLSGSARE